MATLPLVPASENLSPICPMYLLNTFLLFLCHRQAMEFSKAGTLYPSVKGLVAILYLELPRNISLDLCNFVQFCD
jgi:hypothetical protein